MGGWRTYLELQLRARTGLSSGIVGFALLAIASGLIGFGFGLLTLFVWLANRYDPLVAALVLTAFFLLLAVIALICCLLLRRRTVEQAQLALAARRTPWLDPRLLGGAVQATRTLGWRRFAPLLALAVLAFAGVQLVARERLDEEHEEHRPFARAA